MIVEELVVDPNRMLLVELNERAATPGSSMAVITCQYVPVVSATGAKQVAVELAWDPAEPHPTHRYLCPTTRLERVLIDPRRIRSVRPYA